MEEIVANLKLQLALQEQSLNSSPMVPSYSAAVRTNPCCGRSAPQPIFNNIQQPRSCCAANFPTDLELLADQVAVYNQYAPKRGCCGR